MSEEEFLKLLENSKKDEDGNLYVIQEIGTNKFVENENEETHRVYFSTITTICGNLITEHCDKNNENGYELYDRHFWNDDTLEAKIVKIYTKN